MEGRRRTTGTTTTAVLATHTRHTHTVTHTHALTATPPPPTMSASSSLISGTPAWSALTAHAASSEIAGPQAHLASLLQDADRSRALQAEYDGILLDYSRQRVTTNTVNLLFGTYEWMRLPVCALEVGVTGGLAT